MLSIEKSYETCLLVGVSYGKIYHLVKNAFHEKKIIEKSLYEPPSLEFFDKTLYEPFYSNAKILC